MADALQVDVAVVGAGPAGIAAAVRAAEAGRSVVVLDEGLRPGGQIWRHSETGALPGTARRWLERLDRSGARLLSGASVVDATPDPRLLVQHRGAPVVVQAAAVVVATGARELFLPFPGWTLSGVVGVGGAQALLKSGASFAGRRAVVAGSGPLLLPVASALARAGAHVIRVAEQAPASAVLGFGASLWRTPGKVAEAARYRAAVWRAPYRPGTWVTRADGDDSLREVTLTDGRRSWTERCDLLCTGFGLVPRTELARLLGCSVDHDLVRVDDDQRTDLAGVLCAGEPTGIAGVESAVVQGEIAGLAAAGMSDRISPRLRAERDRHRRFAARLRAAFAPRTQLRGLPDAETLVCRCEDVRYRALAGVGSSRAAKLHTRAGMGACQGRVCGPALEFLFGWTADSVRPPVLPAAVSTLIETPLSRDATQGEH